jgi:hypothetical protein
MAANEYSLLCDDFYIDMYINTKLDLCFERDTILSFFEKIQKHYPTLNNFSRRDNNSCTLEESQATGQYRWVSLEIERLGSGSVNPSDFTSAYHLDKLVLETCPYMLGITNLDIDCVDLSFVMDFNYCGNHDEVITEALLNSSAFGSFTDMPDTKIIGLSPSMLLSLSNDNRTQARISIESKTSIFEPGKEKYKEDDAISLYFTIRQYPINSDKFDSVKLFERQSVIIEEIMSEKIIPNFVRPLTNVIAEKRLI